MARTRRRRATNPAARVPELLVSIGCSLIAFSGAWLWWFGEDISRRVIRANDVNDPFAVQVWMRRLHAWSSYALAAVLVFMVVRAAARQQPWRIMFILTFLAFMAVGIWAGFTADWQGARLWSETVGTKLRTGLAVGDGPTLPDALGRARLHLSIIPAALLIVALSAFLQYRRR